MHETTYKVSLRPIKIQLGVTELGLIALKKYKFNQIQVTVLIWFVINVGERTYVLSISKNTQILYRKYSET